MKRILAVNPWIHDFAAFDFWLKPLGLLRIAAAVMDAGVEVHLLDLLDRNHPWLEETTPTDAWGRGKFHAEPIRKPQAVRHVPRPFRRYGLSRSTLEEKLSNLPDVTGVLVTSGMTYWYAGVRETIEVLRTRYPDVPVVLGGVYATILPDHARRHSGADAVLEGPFEAVRERLQDVLGLRLPDAEPPAAWELYPRLDYAVIETSRGCPLRCTYCASHRLAPCFSPRNAQSVLDELRRLHRMGVRRLAFYDDALLFHPSLDGMLERMAELDMGLEFYTPNGLHVTEITPVRAALMRRAGFRVLYLSLESVEEEVLAATGAKLSPEAFKRAVRYLKQAGFKNDALHAYVLFGVPGQSEGGVRRTLKTALELGVTPHLAEFSPVHGTEEFFHCGLREDTDPVLTNNTVWCSSPGLRQTLEFLKSWLRGQRALL